MLGCGNQKPNGWLGVDIANTDEADIVQDLDDTPWDLPSDHFTRVQAIDVYEHIKKPVEFMEEVYRICQDGAVIEIKGPHLSSNNWHDPTHRRLLGTRTFENVTADADFPFYADARFKIVETEIRFAPFRKQPHKHVGYLIANTAPHLYENTFLSRLFPAYDIYFKMTPVTEVTTNDG